MRLKLVLVTVLICLGVTNIQAQSGNSWTQKSNLPGPVRESAVAFSISNKGYVGTGNLDGGNYLWDFWEYDPSTDGWIVKAAFIPAMDSVGRRSAAGFGINGKGYMGPGVGQDTIPPTQGDTMYNDFWEYDVASNSWSQKTTCPTLGRHMYVAFEINGKGYLGTGVTDGISGSLLRDFWEYDPVSDTWSQKADFGGTSRYQAVGFSLLGKGYIGTGLDSNSLKSDLWEFDPMNNSWSQKTGLPTNKARCNATSFAIESVGKGYICLGIGTGGFWDLNEYDPVTDTWTQKANFPAGFRQQASGFAIYNRGYVCFGTDGPNRFNDLWEYTPDSTTSIQVNTKQPLRCYPNPTTTSEGWNIMFQQPGENISVTIYNSLGQLVVSENHERADQIVHVDISTLVVGTYTAQVSVNGAVSYNQQLIITQ